MTNGLTLAFPHGTSQPDPCPALRGRGTAATYHQAAQPLHHGPAPPRLLRQILAQQSSTCCTKCNMYIAATYHPDFHPGPPPGANPSGPSSCRSLQWGLSSPPPPPLLPMVSTLEKRVQKLEGGSGPGAPGAPGALGGWGKEWADFDLIQDGPCILPWCSMDAFVVGRASWVAWKYHGRMVDSYRYWRGHKEPDWYSNPVYLSKPGSIEAVAAERAKYPPASALESFAAFSRWEYSGNGELHDHIAIASAIWLIDKLALPPQQVISNALSHGGAWQWGFDRLARVVAPDAMVMESPLIPLEGFPVPAPWAARVKRDGPTEVLAVLLVVPSGIRVDHGRGLFPTVK